MRCLWLTIPSNSEHISNEYLSPIDWGSLFRLKTLIHLSLWKEGLQLLGVCLKEVS